MGDELIEMLKDEVWRTLPQFTANELQDMCTSLGLEVEGTKKGRKSVLYSTVTKYLMSEQVEMMNEEEEVQVFQNVKAALDGIMKVRTVKEEHTGDASGTSGSQSSKTTAKSSDINAESNAHTSSTIPSPTTPSVTNTESLPVTAATATTMSQQFAQLAARNDGTVTERRIEIARLREFKIDGTVGKGSKDSLSYESLTSQIKRGKEQGYRFHEIVAAVVKKIKSDNPLKDFLEGSLDISEEELFEHLQIEYAERDAMTMLTEMANTRQRPAESKVGFCYRMITMRKRVKELSEQEGHPMNDVLLKRKLFSSLATGLKQGAVRLELQSTLNECKLSDKELVKEVGRIMTKETEHQNKQGGNIVDVNEMEILNGAQRGVGDTGSKVNDTGSKGKDDIILAALNKLTVQASQTNSKLTEMQEEVEELRGKIEKKSVQPEDEGKKGKIWPARFIKL